MFKAMLGTSLLLLFGASWGLTPTLSVFSAPAIATAGIPTLVDFDFGASSCDSPLSQPQDCNWPYLKLWLMADPAYDSGITVWRPYCMVSPCISTNLSNFYITIPPSAVPDGRPYSLTYTLFHRDDNGSYSFFSPIWSAFESTAFNISGANTSWNDYDKQSGRFSTDNSNRAWWANLTCEALGCVRQCALDIEAPLVPFVGGPLPKLDECVEACPGMGWDPSSCITQNAVAVPTAQSPSSTNAAPISTTKSTGSSSTNVSSGLRFAGVQDLRFTIFSTLFTVMIAL